MEERKRKGRKGDDVIVDCNVVLILIFEYYIIDLCLMANQQKQRA